MIFFHWAIWWTSTQHGVEVFPKPKHIMGFSFLSSEFQTNFLPTGAMAPKKGTVTRAMKRPAAKTKPARKEKKGDENEGSEDFEENEEPPTPEEPAGVAKAKAKPKEKSKAKAKAKGKAKAKATEKPGVEVFGFDLVLDHRKFLQTTGNVVEY
jgi:outer membrane biosynthesis protein TonB